MANRIKGITVEIGGDATGLDKALQGVNKSLKDTQSQLKDVERLLKLDPSNTELLTQKQRLLKDAIGNTKEKLDALKDAQEQAKKQLESGDMGQDKYDALQREIIATEQELEKLEEQAKNTNIAMAKISEAGKSVEEFGGKITDVGSALTKGVTAPIMAVGAASMAAFNEVDSAVDSMITKTGAAGEQLEIMEKAMVGIATRVPTDFQTAADAVSEVTSRFKDAGDDVEDLAEYFVYFATVNNTDVTSSVDNVQASLAAFGMGAKESRSALDILTKASQETGTDVNTLSTMITQNAGVMKEMGFSYQDTAFFMANLNKNGVDISSTMTGLKKAWQTASKEGKSMDSMLTDMNNTIKNAKTDQEAYQKAIDLFGAKAGPAIAQAIREGRLSFEEFGYYLDSFDGMLADSFYATLDPIDQTTLMMNELKAVGADLASTAQEMLMPVLEALREKLHQLREWWSGLSEEQQQSIIKFAGIAAAVGPVLVVIGNLVSTVGKGMQAFSALGTAIGGISAPVLAIVAVIAVLVAAFVNLWKNNEEFREKVTAIWENIKKKFEEFGKGIQERLQKLGISFEDITKTIKKIWDGFCELLAPVFEGAFKQISTILSTVLDVLTGLLDIFIGVFTGDWDQAWQGVQEVFTAIWNGIQESLSNALDMLRGLLDTFLGWFGTDWDTVWENAKSTFSNIWDGIKNTAQNVIDSITSILSNIKLPHFSISGEFSLNPPSIPHLSVDWYKKAMNNGMILNSPTIFGMKNGRLLAGGEAGSETVVGTNSLMRMIQAAVDSTGQTFGDVNVYVNSYGTDAAAIAQEIGAAVSRERRMAGSW